MKKHHIQVDKSKCVGCEFCLKDCSAYNIMMVEKKQLSKLMIV